MKENLDFEDKSTKDLLSKYDMSFFLNQNIDDNDYSDEDISTMRDSFQFYQKDLIEKSKENSEQLFLYVEGQVRKMVTGGSLPSLFNLNETRELRILDFKASGHDWAYFSYWQKHYKRKVRLEQFWEWTTKVGSVLAIILTIFQLYEIIIP